MSQAKVDRYKEEKKNRKQIIAKEKRNHKLAVLAGWLVALALVGWAGVSAYNIYENNKPMETIYTDLTALDDYLGSLSTDAE